MSYRAHQAAWLAAITAETGHPTFTVDEIPATLPAMYVVASVTRRAVDVMRFSADRALLGWRLQTESFGTAHSEVQFLRERVERLSDRTLPAIEATRLQPDGEADEPELDEKYGRWSAVDSWIYYAPNPNV